MPTSETDVGITAWANEASGFTATLKQRYSDFQVNEVDSTGAVVHLTSLQWDSIETGPAAGPDSSTAASAIAQEPAAHPAEVATSAAADNALAAAATSADQALQASSAAQDPPQAQSSAPVLTDTASPTPAAAEAASEPTSAAADAAPQTFERQLAAFEILTDADSTATLSAFLAAITAYEQHCAAAAASHAPLGTVQRPEPIHLDVSGYDKGQRTAVHAFFRDRQLPHTQTDSITGEGKDARGPDGGAGVQSIKVTYLPPSNKKRKRGPTDNTNAGAAKRGFVAWDGGGRSYLRFVMAKENLESHAALAMLARFVHAPPSVFAVAGTKDKRGVTVQHVTAHKVAPERLAALNPGLRGIRLGDFAYVDSALYLGAAKGNRFDVVLRDVQSPDGPQGVQAAAAALQGSGFINYFGLQRFGSGSVPTHRVGALLLKGEWQAAIDLILAPHADDREDNAAARRLYTEKGDIAGALKAMPRHLTAEHGLLQGLQAQAKHHPDRKPDLLAVLKCIPHSLRTMYVHAYQSWLWNAAASARVAVHGLTRPVPGDLVLPAGEGLTGATAAAGKLQNGHDTQTNGSSQQPHTVTDEDVTLGRYSIEDVVLPQPGCQTVYPTNDIAQVYHELCAQDGLSLTEPAPHKVRDYCLASMPGAYRRLAIRPKGLTWQLLQYSQPDEPLAISELDRACGKGNVALQCTQLEPARYSQPPVHEAQASPRPGLLALQLQFTLPSATYATMLIRELTKQSTSTAVHRARTLAAAPAQPGGAAASPE